MTGHGPIALDDTGGEARLQALFDRATCFVMPSLHEPSAQAYIEAGTAGIPSIGSTDGGSATVIGPGGVVVDPRDDAAILEAMRSVGSGPRAAELGAAAREHAALLTWPKVAERLIRALRPPGAESRGAGGLSLGGGRAAPRATTSRSAATRALVWRSGRRSAPGRAPGRARRAPAAARDRPPGPRAAARRARGSRGGMTTPASPCSSISGTAPTVEPRTAAPQAIASRTTNGLASPQLGRQKTSARW